MSKLPSVTARKVIKVLAILEFINTRRKGSHFFFRHADGRTTVIPVHPGKTIGIGLLRKILDDIRISPDEFKKLL